MPRRSVGTLFQDHFNSTGDDQKRVHGITLKKNSDFSSLTAKQDFYTDHTSKSPTIEEDSDEELSVASSDGDNGKSAVVNDGNSDISSTGFRQHNGHESTGRQETAPGRDTVSTQATADKLQVDDILRFNVSGGYFEASTSTLGRFSDTLLGSESSRKRYFLDDRKEYFLERNRLIFSAILYFYQSHGKFYRPTCVAEEQFLEEIRFFKLEPYYRKYIDVIDDDKDNSLDRETTVEEELTFQTRCWQFFEIPTSSRGARVWAVLDVIAITVAVAMFIIETIPSIKKDIESDEPNSRKMAFFVIETICIIFFTIELLARLASCPNKKIFMKTAMNWIDFITILPYYIQFAAENNEGQALVVLRVLRVIRVLKLARHSKGILIVTKTLAASVNELALLLFFWFIGVIIFGSIMYYLEYSDDSKFTSILQSSWWAVVTMSTVGYGDMVPATAFGKLVASICMMFSMIVIALPVTVIVSKFTRVYAKYKDKL